MPNKPSRIFQLPWRTRKQIVRDVDAELAFHLEMRVSELVAAGADPEQARRRAGEEFGDLEFTRAYCREVDERTNRETWLADTLTEWRQDIRYAWRTMGRNPSFAIVSLLTLMLAIGANTAIFSVTRAVLLSPLPYGTPSSLVAVYETPRSAPASRNPLSVPNLVDYRAAQHTLTGLAAFYDNVADPEHRGDLKASVQSDSGAQVFLREETRESPDLSSAKGGYRWTVNVPLASLSPGRYVLAIEGRSWLGEKSIKKELEFRIREDAKQPR
jgi:hypothetical protein